MAFEDIKAGLEKYCMVNGQDVVMSVGKQQCCIKGATTVLGAETQYCGSKSYEHTNKLCNKPYLHRHLMEVY